MDKYCKDKKLEYVIATHAHQDHVAAFTGKEGIFSNYKVDTIIDFGESNATSTVYANYCAMRDNSVKEGAKYYSAKQCVEEKDGAKQEYSLGNGLKMKVLYQEAYDNHPPYSDENNNSVCLLFSQGEKKMLFTGDLEKKGCESLLSRNEIGEVDLYKGGHHGSKNANEEFFLDAIKPKTICTCCVAGSEEYTTVKENTMPYQTTIDNWAKYTDEVYLTSCMKKASSEDEEVTYGPLNGDITVTYDSSGAKTIAGSANSSKLKDTEWMKENRTMPSQWLS